MPWSLSYKSLQACMMKSTLNETLIAAVQRRPALYDKTEYSYSDRGYINKLWREIGEELGINGEGFFFNLLSIYCNLIRALIPFNLLEYLNYEINESTRVYIQSTQYAQRALHRILHSSIPTTIHFLGVTKVL